MTVAFPLSPRSMVMDFSFCSPFKAVLSYLVRFSFGAFADFRTPAMSARSFIFVLVVGSMSLVLSLR